MCETKYLSNIVNAYDSLYESYCKKVADIETEYNFKIEPFEKMNSEALKKYNEYDTKINYKITYSFKFAIAIDYIFIFPIFLSFGFLLNHLFFLGLILGFAPIGWFIYTRVTYKKLEKDKKNKGMILYREKKEPYSIAKKKKDQAILELVNNLSDVLDENENVISFNDVVYGNASKALDLILNHRADSIKEALLYLDNQKEKDLDRIETRRKHNELMDRIEALNDEVKDISINHIYIEND